MDQSQGGNPFGRLIEFARPHKTGYIVSVVLAVLGVAFGIVPYFATARMTIELLSGNRDLSFYMVWCLISGGCFVLKAILMGISTRASHEATFEVLSEARRKIASKLTRVPMGYILNTPSGQLKNGMVERIEQLEVPLAHVIPEMTSNLLVPIAIIVYLFILDWRMALVSLITIPVGMIRLEAQTEFMDAVLEYIQGMGVVRAFHMAKQSNTTLEKSIDETQKKNQLIERQRIPYIAAEQVVLRIASAAAAFCSIALFINGTLELTYCLIILVSAFMVYSQLESAGEMFFMLSMIDASIDRVEEINQSPQIDIDGKEQTPDRLDIEMQDISFSYGDKKVIDHVSLTIPQGTTTAIVGPSGSGKTTLVNLIARFWDVDSGSVRIGGIDVKDYKLDSLMKNISMVWNMQSVMKVFKN